MGKKQKNINIRFLKVSNNYLEKKLPSDIIFKIYNHYKLLLKLKLKWLLIYSKINLAINSNSHRIIKKLHEYHDFGRNITMTAHLCYEKNEGLIAKKLINLSTAIHFLVSRLIIKTIKFRDLF